MIAPATAGPPVLDRRDAAVLRVLAAAAALAAAVWFIGAIAAVLVPLLGADGLTLSLLTADGAVPPPIGAADLPVGVALADVTTLDVTVATSTLSAGATTLLILEIALMNLVGGIVTAAVAYALLRIARGEAFHRSMFGVAITAGVALTSGMVSATGLGGLGRMMAGDELNTLLGTDTFAVGFYFSFTPVLVGVAVLGLAAVFRIGARLQRETDGLV